MNKHNLLFISPVIPSETGFGLAMRAGALIKTLSEWYRIFLLVVPVQDPGRAALPPAMQPFVSGTHVVNIGRLQKAKDHVLTALRPGPMQPREFRLASPEWVERASAAFPGVDFAALCVFRLYMVPFAAPWRGAVPASRQWLDLDELDSSTLRRIAALYLDNGLHSRAGDAEHAAGLYEACEAEMLPGFAALSVCSPQEAARLPSLSPGQRVLVLPNTVPEPVPPARPAEGGGPFTFVFAGNLGYYPNEDAVTFLLESVLPELRKLAARPFRIVVAGAGGKGPASRYRSLPECSFAGQVPDMAAVYRGAGACVVPVRAGGGTRIKAIEAFSHRLPLVSTSTGVEGLEVANEQEALIADSAEGFAGACARVLQDADLRERLTGHAFRLWQENYTPTVLQRQLAGLLRNWVQE